MENIIYFDSGTTNSRAYYIKDGIPTSSLSKKIGTINNVLSGDPNALLKGLKELYDALLAQLCLCDCDIKSIYMSGMVTSKNGIYEVPYLHTPVDAFSYQAKATIHRFPLFERDVYLLPGIVSLPNHNEITLENIASVNNVRGEEIEMFGLASNFPSYFQDKHTAVIMPGSHSHILYMQKNHITEITSCFGGELYSAITNHTILNASASAAPEDVQTQYVKKGYCMVQKYGVNRALYITRTMTLFLDAPQIVRDSYLEGVVNSGIITALTSNPRSSCLDYIVIAGSSVYYKIFSALLDAIASPVPCVWLENTQSFALSGFLHLLSLRERSKIVL